MILPKTESFVLILFIIWISTWFVLQCKIWIYSSTWEHVQFRFQVAFSLRPIRYRLSSSCELSLLALESVANTLVNVRHFFSKLGHFLVSRKWENASVSNLIWKCELLIEFHFESFLYYLNYQFAQASRVIDEVFAVTEYIEWFFLSFYTEVSLKCFHKHKLVEKVSKCKESMRLNYKN